MAKKRMKPAGKIIILLIIAAGLFFGYTKLDKIAPSGEKESSSSSDGFFSKKSDKGTIKIGVVTWGGYAGGQYFNRGFKPNDNSQFRKQYGFDVEFKVLDDYEASRNAFKAGAVDLLWTTIDAYPVEAGALGATFLFQADWSRGGDAIVATEIINKPGDLRGKKIAYLPGSPSHTFLIYFLEANGINANEIKAVEVKDAIEAAKVFKAGQSDAAVVWSPDDAICISEVRGSKILASTKEATHIIADGFLVKPEYLQANKDKLVKLVEGWFKGAAEINSNPQAKEEASQILASGLGISASEAMASINNVRLTNYGDNLNFFGINSDYDLPTGKSLYSKMKIIYDGQGLTSGRTPSFDAITDISVIQSVNLQAVGGQEGELQAKFSKADKKVIKKEAFSSKPVSITFATGRYDLDQDAQYTIKKEFIPTAKSFPNLYIRIEGNTEMTGNYNNNIQLSRKRAKSVADFLTTLGMDPNRFIIQGNGPDKPLCQEQSTDCYSQNRRTDFELIASN